ASTGMPSMARTRGEPSCKTVPSAVKPGSPAFSDRAETSSVLGKPSSRRRVSSSTVKPLAAATAGALTTFTFSSSTAFSTPASTALRSRCVPTSATSPAYRMRIRAGLDAAACETSDPSRSANSRYGRTRRYWSAERAGKFTALRIIPSQVALQIKDYLAEGIIRNAVNLPALSADQYRRVRPYLELAERLGSLVSQAAASRPARIRIRYAGEVAEVGTHLLRSAVLAGVLNAVLDEKVNVVNAPAVAAARGLTVEEETRRRELGFPNTLEVSALSEKAGDPGFTAEGTVLHDGSPRVLAIDGIPVEAQLAGTILYLRNQDEPGVIGQVGSTLGKLGVNIATFALGRREAVQGAEAAALVRVDGVVSPSILEPIRAHERSSFCSLDRSAEHTSELQSPY